MGWTLVTLGYYFNDSQCDKTLFGYNTHGHCSVNGWAGTNNEPIYTLSCKLAWFIYDNYSIKGERVQLVGHSMGGLIIRGALTLQEEQNNLDFPPYLMVQDVVTFASPLAGITGPQSSALRAICGDCSQALDMLDSGNFVQHLLHSPYADKCGIIRQ
jgi:hypothetical protein